MSEGDYLVFFRETTPPRLQNLHEVRCLYCEVVLWREGAAVYQRPADEQALAVISGECEAVPLCQCEKAQIVRREALGSRATRVSRVAWKRTTDGNVFMYHY